MLAELLVDEICAAKDMILDETILDADIMARTGLVDLITEAFGAGIAVGVVSTGSRTWVEPLVRQLVGDGLVETVIVTADDVAARRERLSRSRAGRARRVGPRFAGVCRVAGESARRAPPPAWPPSLDRR